MKSKANKIISLSFAAIMIFSSAAISYGASKDITRTNIFYSKTKKYEYAAQKEIQQDGKTYKLKDIKYKLVADKGAETKNVKLENLTEEKAPATKSFEVDGKKVTFTLDTDATKFEKNKRKAHMYILLEIQRALKQIRLELLKIKMAIHLQES